jgi:alpha/beta superfamily hydrolase
MTRMIRNILIICLTFYSLYSQASDLAKEKRWADQVVDAIIDGDAVWLNDGKHEFLGIYTEAAEDKERAAIIMHGTGIHPNWEQIIQPLRVGLTEHGWHTLSIQMPVLDNEASHADYAPLYDEVPSRIDAAIKYLHANGIKNIVLIGHSQGSAMGAYYLSKHHDDVKAFVAIGMPGDAVDSRMNTLVSLKTISIPVLDLYGSEDLESVLMSDRERMATAKSAGNKNYTQEKVDGANHFFDDKNEALLENVSKWLNKLPK